MKAPVVMVIFNRPSFTQRVFDRVREYAPPRLLVVADGPRSDAEAVQCAATRAVIDRVDWPCEVLTNYADVNLGCDRRVTSGLSWAFEQCEEAIVLEDDCVPHPSFFPYCVELLDAYRHDERVMMINGCNLQFGRKRTPYSYYFSRYPHVWGWASWRRAWRYYGDGVGLWPTLRRTSWLQDLVADKDAAAYFRIEWDAMLAGGRSWDYQWTFTCWVQNGLAITPNANLISNIGFGEAGTRAIASGHPFAVLPTEAIDVPLRHPPGMVRHAEADRFEFRREVPNDVRNRLRRRASAAVSPAARTRIHRHLTHLRFGR